MADYLTTSEMARALSTSLVTLRRLLRFYGVPVIRLTGGAIRVQREEWERFLKDASKPLS